MNTWKTARSFDPAYIRDIEDEEGETVAQVLDLDDYAQDIKRARLIAAAPDLFAALDDLLSYLEGYDHDYPEAAGYFDRARAALAKAEGVKA